MECRFCDISCVRIEPQTEKGETKMNNAKMLSDQELDSVSGGVIPEGLALENVLRHIKAAEKDVDQFKKVTLNTLDGRKVYKVELSYKGTDYAFNVDAASGKVLKV